MRPPYGTINDEPTPDRVVTIRRYRPEARPEPWLR